MSYLIGLYVYYHGNNLEMFGFDKGALEIENQNQGLQRPGDVSNVNVEVMDVNSEVKEMVKSQQQREANTINYEEMLRKAIYESQQETKKLAEKNLVNDSIMNNTPEYLSGQDYMPNTSNMPLSLFDELNGFDSGYGSYSSDIFGIK